MQSYLLVGPIDGSASVAHAPNHWDRPIAPLLFRGRRLCSSVVTSATARQNHYSVLGVSPDASSGDIKKAYRALALKYHPDVSKEAQADQVFKSIRLAYDTLSNDVTRIQYDRSIQLEGNSSTFWGRNWAYDPEFDDGVRVYRWTDLRRRMRHEKYWERQNVTVENSAFYDEDEMMEEGSVDNERGSLGEFIGSAFLSLFLMQTIGARLSLTFSSLMALLDPRLDSGYKMGHLIAWILGGKSGILLALCLSCASSVCGRTSSSVVAVVAVAMWVGSKLATFAPLPQGALLTLIYMSIKLQADLS